METGAEELKHINSDRISNKIVLVILSIIVLVFILFISLPILAVFLKLDVSQASSQLQNSDILNAISLGLLTSSAATIASFFFTVPTAYILATRKFYGSSIIDTLIDIPIVLPPAVAGVALLLAFAPKGLLGPLLNTLGLTLPGSTIAVIMAQMFVASPFILRSAKTAFENVNPDLINSARILTGSNLRVFLTIMLPLTIRQILSGIMMTWARSMGEFGATLMFAGNLPGITQTMPLAIYLLMSKDPFAAIVLSAIMIAISFSVLIVVKLLEKKKYGVKS
jgi:molybdate transport system permease protein